MLQYYAKAEISPNIIIFLYTKEHKTKYNKLAKSKGSSLPIARTAHRRGHTPSGKDTDDVRNNCLQSHPQSSLSPSLSF